MGLDFKVTKFADGCPVEALCVRCRVYFRVPNAEREVKPPEALLNLHKQFSIHVMTVHERLWELKTERDLNAQ